MEFKTRLTKNAVKDLKKLPSKTGKAVVTKLLLLTRQGLILKNAKKLHGGKESKYRLRMGDYRLVFGTEKESDNILIIILNIAHRKDIYKKI
jgi:mRNA-degrading endonuclease RelE of RelBE toxin-antitoxin system